MLLSLPLGTAWHELMGHGLVSVLCGGRIGSAEVLGVQVWPGLGWRGWPQVYGTCQVEDVPTAVGDQLTLLAGSMSTWLVAVGATTLLWMRHWHGFSRAMMICLSLWWIDLLTYTLPSWGLRRSILRGRVYSEPYQAATALGIPGPAFQGFVVLSSAVLLAVLGLRLMGDSRRTGRGQT